MEDIWDLHEAWEPGLVHWKAEDMAQVLDAQMIALAGSVVNCCGPSRSCYEMCDPRGCIEIFSGSD